MSYVPGKPFARSYAVPRDGGKSDVKRPHAAAQSYAPGQICAAYNWPTGIAVRPMTIVIAELGGRFYPADVAPWALRAGLPTPAVRTQALAGADDSPGDADGEVALDWQRAAEAWSYLTGTPADVLIVYGPNSGRAFADVMNAYAHSSAVGAGSWSWGAPEGGWSAADRAAYDAAARACPFPWCAASGDNDSNDGTNSPAVDFPAASPYSLGCGGTSRVPAGGAEAVWNNGRGEGTGGGFSKFYPTPPWQPANAQGAGRMVPDWAAVADPNTGYDTLVNGRWQVIGGTSAVAPLLAGFLAAVNGARLLAGLPAVGQANALLWQLAAAFFDITSGTNGGYRAAAGPDPCTGLGRPLPALFAALTGKGQVPPPPPPGPVPPPVSVPPAPAPAKLFSLPFPAVRAGQRVQFTAPVNIPAGVIDFVPETMPKVEVVAE